MTNIPNSQVPLTATYSALVEVARDKNKYLARDTTAPGGIVVKKMHWATAVAKKVLFKEIFNAFFAKKVDLKFVSMQINERPCVQITAQNIKFFDKKVCQEMIDQIDTLNLKDLAEKLKNKEKEETIKHIQDLAEKLKNKENPQDETSKEIAEALQTLNVQVPENDLLLFNTEQEFAIENPSNDILLSETAGNDNEMNVKESEATIKRFQDLAEKLKNKENLQNETSKEIAEALQTLNVQVPENEYLLTDDFTKENAKQEFSIKNPENTVLFSETPEIDNETDVKEKTNKTTMSVQDKNLNSEDVKDVVKNEIAETTHKTGLALQQGKNLKSNS